MTGAVVSGDRRITLGELQDRAARAATGFSKCGVSEGDAVVLILRNDLAFFEAAMGAAIVGAYAVPVNWHFTAPEATYILEDCGAKVVVIHADLLPGLRQAIPEDTTVLVVPTAPELAQAYGIESAQGAVAAGCADWNAWLDAQEVWRGPTRTARTNIIYTSGTTGAPKGVVRDPPTPEQETRFAEILGIIFGFSDGQELRTVITGPIYHSAPNTYALLSARRDGLVVLQPRFDAEDLLRLVERHRITHLHMVPIMFVRLLKLPDAVKGKYDLSSLKFVVHAAAPCPPEVKRQMIEWWGPVINEYYGSTETGPPIFHTSEEALRKPGTAGRRLEGTVVKVLDGEGRELAPGEVGEIYLRVNGHADFTYRNNPEKRCEMERDGLVTVGDIGYFDEDGYLFLCDRATDMVISGGVNIYPAEIEAVLIEMPGVKDCAVFGIPDEEFGEALCAHIEPESEARLMADEINAWLADRLAKFKIPGTLIFVEALPREDSGKIMKRKLRDAYWGGQSRNI